ncbi:MAG: hypothetical protein ACLS7Z_05850 [Christensenellales bacterium]
MRDIIRIQMMGEFVIYINERQADHMVNKSRKGLALIEYLIWVMGSPFPINGCFPRFGATNASPTRKTRSKR